MQKIKLISIFFFIKALFFSLTANASYDLISAYYFSPEVRSIEEIHKISTSTQLEDLDAQIGYILWKMESADYGESYRVAELAKNKGSALALYLLGIHHYKGFGREIDLDKAILFFEEAISLNEPRSMMALSEIYRNGIGKLKDARQADYWLKKSANAGYNVAQYELALKFEKSSKLSDQKLAFEYMNRSTENVMESGNNYYKLAQYYENGFGTKKDIEKASQKYQLAIDGGIERAREDLIRIGIPEPANSPQ